MRKLKVLIVEDDTVSATLHKAMLEAEGHNIVGVARSEEDAVALAKEASPDVVLMDVYLEGGSSGVLAAKEIYSAHALPVIFVTCGTAVEQLQELVDSDAFALIKKPISLEELRVNLSIVMRREEDIRKNQDGYKCCQVLFDLLPYPVLGVRKTGELDWCNNACAHLFGYLGKDDFCSGYKGIEELCPVSGKSLLDGSVNLDDQLLVNRHGKEVSCSLFKMEDAALNLTSERVFFAIEQKAS